jgi:hypothetical protein
MARALVFLLLPRLPRAQWWLLVLFHWFRGWGLCGLGEGMWIGEENCEDGVASASLRL